MAEKLVITIEAQSAAAKAQLKELQAGLKDVHVEGMKLNAVHQDGAKHATTHHEAIRKLGEGLKQSGEHAKGFGEALKKVAEVGLGAGAGVGILGLLGGAMGFGAILEQTRGFDKSVADLARTMNGSAEAASKWIGVAEEVGVSSEAVAKGMKLLSVHIDQNSKVLNEMGIATVDSKGKLLTLDTVLGESRKWFQQHEGSTLAAAKAQELFGRGGLQLLPVLTMTDKAFTDLTRELKAYGLIVDNDMLAKSRAMEFEIKHFETALKGITVTIGHELMPVVAQVASMLSNWLAANIDKVRDAIGRLVSFVQGLIEGFTGVKFVISDTSAELAKVADAAGNAGDAADTSADQAKKLAGQQKALREATKDATDALNAQIKAIQNENQAENDAIDAQIAAIDAKRQDEASANEQVKQAGEKAKKQQEIAKLRSEYEKALMMGDLEHAQAINQQINDATQSMTDLDNQIKQKADDEKASKDKKALEDKKKANDRTHQSMIQQLQEQIKAVQDAAQKQADAMQEASERMVSDFQGASAGISNAISGAKGEVVAHFKDMEQKGQEWADKIKQFVKDASDFASTTIRDIKDAIKWVADNIMPIFSQDEATRNEAMRNLFNELGTTAGKAFTDGFGNWLRDHAKNLPGIGTIWGGGPDWTGGVHGLGPPAVIPPTLPSQSGGSASGDGFEYASGGMVPGPLGRAQRAVVHGGEMILNPDQQARLFGGGMGATVHATINVVAGDGMSDSQLAKKIKQEVASLAGLR